MTKNTRKMDSETDSENIVYQSSGIRAQESLISLYVHDEHKEFVEEKSVPGPRASE